MAPAVRPSATIKVEGLRELRRDLREIDKRLPREVNQALREAMRPVTREAAALAPKRTGRLAASLRPFAAGSKIGIRSPLPYANAIHWGGTTGRGHTRTRPGATKLPRRAFTLADGQRVEGYRPFIWQAAARQEKQIVTEIGKALERLADRHGFHH